jgi:hypothetical protein
MEICSTLEWWTVERCFVSYVTSSVITSRNDGLFELKIVYSRGRNAHVPEGAVYGTATILLSQSAKAGKAYWHERGKIAVEEPAHWRRVTLSVVHKKARKRYQVTKAERRQAMFRLALLARYRCCAITGESTPSALEAAHVIAASADGNEIIGNGILLRADIHRLYDSNAFAISRTGKITIAKNYPLSKAYERLLRKAKLSSDLIADLAC